MEYVLIIILELCGIALHVLRKVFELDKKSPDDKLGEVFKLFWSEDRVTLLMSAVVLVVNLVAHYIVHVYASFLVENQYYYVIAFTLAFVIGYFGQRKIYSVFGVAEKVIDKRVERLEKQLS